MFQPINVEEDLYQLKPMNCPFHCLVYKDSKRSYRDLPFRWAELGTVYRYEKSGTLHGLFRVRGFTQDDAHIFCLPHQLEDEIIQVLNLTEKILSKFGFTEFDVMLSTRPAESVGTDDIWDKATSSLAAALVKKGWAYSVDEGGGAFYGPKIDLKIRDAIGRKWQCSTIQCDFNLPERFDLTYVDKDQISRRPIMVHRAIFGSLERFFGVLIENCAGDFPLWLAPVHLRLLPVIDSAVQYCKEIQEKGRRMGLRIDIDETGNRIAKQIRTCEKEKIPLSGIIGAEELSSKTLSLRVRKGGDIGRFDLLDVLSALKTTTENCEDMQYLKNQICR
jgi:threonyl-tRNA synthetase